jgi:hypothetical protein
MAKRRKPNRNPDHGKGLLKRLAERPINAVAVQGGKQEQFVLMDIDVTWDVMSDPVLEALPMATQDRIQEVFELVQEKPQSVIQELRDLVALYPNVPSLTNWLINVLRAGTTADHCEAMELCQALFHRVPNYFFARTTLADLWLGKGEIEKAAELLFGPGCVLTQLYPDRKVFHISEIRHWLYLCARIKIFLGEPRLAESYRDLLDQLEPDSPSVLHLNEMLEGENSMLLHLNARFRKLFSIPKAGD